MNSDNYKCFGTDLTLYTQRIQNILYSACEFFPPAPPLLTTETWGSASTITVITDVVSA
jgi:hypothetical protein